MNSLLEPAIAPDMAGVFAREPLEPMFTAIVAANADANNSSLPQLRVLFGDHDWMRPNQPSAIQALQQWNTSSSIQSASLPNVDITANPIGPQLQAPAAAPIPAPLLVLLVFDSPV